MENIVGNESQKIKELTYNKSISGCPQMNKSKTIVILNKATAVLKERNNIPKVSKVKNLILTTLMVLLSSSTNVGSQSAPASWSNPVMNPYGQNLASYVKAHYRVGDLKTMRKFIVYKELNAPTEKELSNIMISCSWGYDFKMKNCTWLNKREFYLTVETNKMNTTGIENYYGIILKDTARLIINKHNQSNPFARTN
jgi:hypothetical protein